MSFDIEINKEEVGKFIIIMKYLYPDFNYAQLKEGDKSVFKVLGEDMEKDCLLQETLIQHLDCVNMEEEIG